MNDFVTKPVDPPALYGSVLKWLETRTVANESIEVESLSPRTAPPSIEQGNEQEVMERLSAAGIDVTAGLAILKGRIPLYLKLLQRLVDDHRHDPARLAALHASGDRAGAREITHALKGITGNLRLAALMETAKAFDDRLVAQRASDEDNVVPALIESLERQIEQIAKALG